MLDYNVIIDKLNPSAEQIQEAEMYALAMITEEVHETHPDAVVMVEEGCIHIVSEEHSDDLIFPMQYSFNAFFANKLVELQNRTRESTA